MSCWERFALGLVGVGVLLLAGVGAGAILQAL